MKIARIQTKEDLENTSITKWEPIDYRSYPELKFLDDENKADLPPELQDLLIDEYQIVKVKTEDGRETYLQAVRSQFDDRTGRNRTDQFEYSPHFDSKLKDKKLIEQLKEETGCSLWGVGFNFGYLKVLVPWCD